jgi:hypothetical protein
MQFRALVKNYLEERDYRPLYHAICAAVIIAAACFLLYKNFVNPGMMMSSDMTWPDTLARLQFRTFNTWFPYGSTPATSAIQWFFWIFPSSMVARVLHVSAPRYMFLLFLGTFSLAGISMYALAFSTIRSLKLKGIAGYAPYVGSVFAGLVYMYNPWSLHYFRPYFAYPIYALTPLLFLAMVKTYRSPSVRNIILLALLATIANTSHNQTWLIGLFGAYFIFFVISNRFGRDALKRSLKVVLGTAGLYLLLNAIWTVPFLGAVALGKPLLPFYSPGWTEAMLQGLSSNSYMMNNLRLLSIWSWNIDVLGGGQFLQALTFGLPVLTIVSLILVRKEARKNSTINFWAVLAIITLLLATGTSSVLRGFYNWLVFRAPGAATFGWLLRSPERWLFFVAPFIALMLGILVARLLPARPTEATSEAGLRRIARMLRYSDEEEKPDRGKTEDKLFEYPTTEGRIVGVERSIASRRYRNSTIIAVLLVILVLVSMYPKALDFANRVFSPADVPKDYQQFTDYLSTKPGTPRVAWLPFFPPQQFRYAWAPIKTITWFSVMTSNPSLSSINEVMNRQSYFNWLQSLYLKVGGTQQNVTLENKPVMMKTDIMSRLFAPFSTSYVVHDASALGYDFGNSFATDTSLNKAFTTSFLKTYRTDGNPGYVWAATQTLKAVSFYDNLAFVQRLSPEAQDNLAYTDGNSYFGASPDVSAHNGAVKLTDYLKTVNLNPGFEQVEDNGMPRQWVEFFKNPHAQITTDRSTKTQGKRSLRIENRTSKTMGVARVVSDELPVQPGGIYTIDTSVKYQNVNWTNVSVEGYNSRLNKWIQIAQCPVIGSGDSDWQSYHCAFWIPEEITKIRPLLGGGWVRNAYFGNAISWFDDVRISRVDDSLYNVLSERPEAPKITFKKVTAEKYKVSVRGANAPFVLVQSESYDPLWVAKFSDGARVDSIPMYATINGYRINRTGNFDLVLEYQPQQFWMYGLALTILTLLLCLAYLIYVWRAKPGTLKNGAGRVARAVAGTGSRIGGSVRARIKQPPGRGTKKAGKRADAARAGPLRRAVGKARSLIERPPKR